MNCIKLGLSFCLFLTHSLVWGQTPFGEGNLLLLKAGNGSASVNGAPLALVEYDRDGQKIQTVSLPSAGSNRVVLADNQATTKEGFLNLSDDNKYVSFSGYNAPSGTANLQNSSSGTYPRLVGRVDASGIFSVVEAASITSGTGTGVRSAILLNKNQAWTIGQGNFMWYSTMDGSISRRTWSTSDYTFTDNNNLAIFHNNIYFSKGGASKGLYKVNTDNNRFPVVTTASKPALLNLPGLGTEPNGFVFFDTDENSEPDLVYIADENGAVGVQKYYYDGSNWIARGSIEVPQAVSNKNLRGLVGTYLDGKYVIYGNTGSSVLSFTDSATPASDISATTAILATAETNYAFKGISFTPGTKKTYPRPESYAQRIKSYTNLINTISQNETYRKFPGLEETHLKYKNFSGQDMAIWFLTIDLSNPNIKMEAGMPNGATNFGVQTVRNQVSYKNTARNPEYKVLAATNGDYWDISGNLPAGTPWGLVYINGTMIKELPTDNYHDFFLAILKDNTAVIGNPATYATVRDQINYALGGRFYLVRNKGAYPPTASGTDDQGVNPRTAAGTLSSTRLIIAVIDGRRTGHSVGLSLAEITEMYRAIGATDVLNMDGGGSSTLITKSQNNDVYSLVNQPSDNVERSVANSWMVLGKTDQVTPVRFRSFTGKMQGNSVKLSWSTASESNNSHFEVIRSNTSELGLPIGTVAGSGNSNGIKSYSFTDTSPLAGINYYQLKQVDFSGKSEKSAIIAVNTDLKENSVSLYKEGRQLVTAIYWTDISAKGSIQIADMSGRVISRENITLENGQNTIKLMSPALNGIYVATLDVKGEKRSVKFLW